MAPQNHGVTHRVDGPRDDHRVDGPREPRGEEETMPRAAYRNSSSLNAQLFWQCPGLHRASGGES